VAHYIDSGTRRRQCRTVNQLLTGQASRKQESDTMAFRPIHETQQALGTLQDEMNRMFERVWHAGLSTPPLDGQQWAPTIDIYEHDDRFVMYVEMAGVEAEDVDVSHIGNSLTIRGEKRPPAGIEEGTPSLQKERRFGTFCRTIELPGGVDADKVTARCHCGVLEVTVPKSEVNRPKSIKIDVDEG
jgi:HSP20 family protein